MFLKCIEMTGFKSFPEKTAMQMNGSITGVVGPNGSGKSNVSDAVRWVLGEQSAKSLRGTIMQDVIFAGTQKRKPRSYCEVSLIFDNSDKRMNMAYSEIQVTRKLYRSGESEYAINGTKCRLKDILAMFRDTGIGKEGYSIIGQGRIEEILSEKSVDRRRVFEEASGIMKYRVRKEEAERKLEKTRFNLLRIEDILKEQETRIAPLKRQAEGAAEYIELSEKLKTLQVNLFLNNYENGQERIDKLRQTLTAIAEEYADKERALSALGASLSCAQETAGLLDTENDTLSAQLSSSLAEIERVEGEINLCDERLTNIVRDIERVKSEIDAAVQKAEAIVQNEETNVRRLSQISDELETQQGIAGQAREALEALGSVFEDRMKIIETVQSEKVETIEKMAEVDSALAALKEKQQSMQQRADEIDGRIGVHNDEMTKHQEEQERLAGEQKVLDEKREMTHHSLNEKVFARNELAQDIEKKQNELEIMRRDHAASATSAKVLADMKNSYEGYLGSVKRLMSAAKTNNDIGRRIVGAFADVIEVPRKYETAIETVLGTALQNIVVRDADDAKEIIAFLRRNDMGRVTFLPLGDLKYRGLTNDEQSVIRESGVYGVAQDLVSYDAASEKAVAFLLGRTLIVEDNDTAIRVMRKYSYVFRTVTLDGDVFNPGGAITGGSIKRSGAGLVSRDRQAEELEKRAGELASQVSRIEQALLGMTHRRDELVRGIELDTQVLHEGEIASATIREKRTALAAALEENTAALLALRDEKAALVEQLETMETEIRGFAALHSDMAQSKETKSEDYKRMEDEYTKNAAQIEQKKTQLHDAEIRIAELFKENAALLNDNLRLGIEKQEIEKDNNKRRTTLMLNAETEENLGQLKTRLEALRAEKAGIMDGLQKQREQIMKKREEAKKALSKTDEEIEVLRKDLNAIAEKKMRTEFSIEKVESGIEAAQNRLWETYQLTYAGALPMRQEIDVSEAQTSVDNMKRRLRALGNVNPNAIEEYAELSGRMRTLTAQRDDLKKAENDLHTLITSLMSEMKKVFALSFEEINTNFKKTFKELFGGGRAELLLEDDQDIMECGIEIVAEPPGKKLQKISLLSGGEKALTAICLLFALLNINPSPVCILDEIDAALDEANVYKFSDYLKKYARDMQFIVITHRKPTMIVCDSLYGFAMEEKGVSKLLSVRLD